MNYLVLVNKTNLIQESYYKDVNLLDYKSVLNEDIKVEKKTLEAYKELKKFLETINIYIEIDSSYRSIEDQQKIIDEFAIKYGKDYVNRFVAPIKSSEHHTGLAIDLCLIVNNKLIYENDDLMDNENIFIELHKYLHNFGFILRYPKGKESITGYDYEPWHIRYVEKEVAVKIYEKKLTLEEYLCKIYGKGKK